MVSVYIHIPFCERICTYCDFPKRVGTVKQMDAYLKALEKEILRYNVKEPLKTLYIGGGTPSILKGEQLDYFKAIIQLFHLSDTCEFTVECNPEHITDELLIAYKEMGVNRISLGVQTFNDRLLKLLNRNHNEAIVYQAIDRIRSFGIENITVDLIFSLPMQTKQNLYDDLNHIKKLNIPHISCYSLILEEKTVLSKLIRENKLQLLENEVEAEMYQIVMDELKAMGYHHYEISNFAKEGYESNHNQIYWLNEHYYGFGMGASGYLNNVRYSNHHLVTQYIEQIDNQESAIESEEVLSREDQIKEAMMLGLRLLKGVSIESVNKQYDIDLMAYFKEELDELVKQGWIIIDDVIRLSHTGLFYGNEVFGKFI
jgi:oxygen-independent coproporphyrinogen III oxidase